MSVDNNRAGHHRGGYGLDGHGYGYGYSAAVGVGHGADRYLRRFFFFFFFSFPGPLLGLCLARVALGPILQALWRVRLGDRTVWAAGVAGTGPVQRYGQVFGANGGRLKRRSEAPA